MNNESPPSVDASAGGKPRFGLHSVIIAALVLALLAGGAWYFWGRSADTGLKAGEPGAASKSGAPGGPGGGRFGADPNRVQPVSAVAAKVGDINIVQNGLGTVTALKTVTVKARVDGQLQNVLFREGQMVKAGEVLAEIDPKPIQAQLTQVEGQMARDQALLANARLDLERYRTLLAQDSIAKQQLDAQESLVSQFEGTVKSDQGQVDNARLQLGYTRITAPIAGRLGLRQVDAGNMIHAADANGLVVITQVDPITVLFTIPQDNLPRVLKQLQAGERLAAEAWDREQKVKLALGFLLTADNQIDIATGTVKLKAQFPNPDGALFPNQFVNVRMVVDTKKGATIIPVAGVQRGAQGTIVYVVKQDKTIAMRPVKLGTIEGENVAIDSGINPGELVVVDGIDRLREGAKVEVSAPVKLVPAAPGRDAGKRGQGRKGDGSAGAAPGEPGAASPASPASAPAPAASGKAASAAAAQDTPRSGPSAASGEGAKAASWRDLSEQQKAEIRKKMSGMSEEQKTEFRKTLRERAQKGAEGK